MKDTDIINPEGLIKNFRGLLLINSSLVRVGVSGYSCCRMTQVSV